MQPVINRSVVFVKKEVVTDPFVPPMSHCGQIPDRSAPLFRRIFLAGLPIEKNLTVVILKIDDRPQQQCLTGTRVAHQGKTLAGVDAQVQRAEMVYVQRSNDQPGHN